MSLDVKIEFKPSYYKKTNHNNIKKAFSNALKKLTIEASNECKIEAPVDTGLLQSSINPEIKELEGIVHAGVDYGVYVAFGTSKMDANNYPQRALNNLQSSGKMGDLMVKEIKQTIGE